MRADNLEELDVFRALIKTYTRHENEMVVVNYNRSVMGQLGKGHFAPVAGYHAEQDMVLIMDTAQYKYPPHWIKLDILWKAMQVSNSSFES